MRPVHGPQDFDHAFRTITGYEPLPWQRRLHAQLVEGVVPRAIDLPTGLGKTSVMALWWLARLDQAALPRRLVYVVDRRTVVDQATTDAERIAGRSIPAPVISTLRGGRADTGEWLQDPARPAIIVGTVDMIGSRLLFGGYGVSRAMRPFHAGLLANSTLLVLDEAHLSAPFEALVRSVEVMTSGGIRLMTLSATGAGASDFTLDTADAEHPIVQARTRAQKRLRLAEPAKADAKAIALSATLIGEGMPSRVVVFVASRDLATKVAAELRKATDDRVVMLVGARRGHEREKLAADLQDTGFLGEEPATGQAYLVATSAGEVGVDLDADHAVMDLVPFERMVQRLGRVNRRGREGHVALVEVMPLIASGKVDPAALERLRLTAELLAALPATQDGAPLASPASLAELKAENGEDVRRASSPVPLHPPLTRPLVEAWSMTSLTEHSGRPEPAPWLRGWVDEEPQTTVVWRTHLPVIVAADSERPDAVVPRVVETFFEIAPPHISERLETETSHVAGWVLERRAAKGRTSLAPGRVVAVVLSAALEFRASFTARDLFAKDGLSRDRLERALASGLLVVDARIGGLVDGLLDGAADADPPTADGGSADFPVAFRVERHSAGETPDEREGWRHVRRFEVERSRTGDPLAELTVFVRTGAVTSEETRSVSKPVPLADHTGRVEALARTFAAGVGLAGTEVDAIAEAARLHDVGKAVPLWQNAMNAPAEGRPYAKTSGGNGRLLGGYRHEFGSLLAAERAPLGEETRDLVLHLVAAHHGRARPLLPIEGAEGRPETMRAVAGEAARRFARLTRRYGPWGLAFREAILRAADHSASRAEAKGADDGDE